MGPAERRKIKELQEHSQQAVREGLNLIRLQPEASAAERHIHFESGVLQMHGAYALGTAGMLGDGEIRDVLLAGV